MGFNFRKKNFIYTYKDFYQQYKKKKRASGFKPREIIDEPTYRAAMEDFFLLVCRKIIVENFIFILPLAMGHLFLKGIKMPVDKAPIDWGLTRKLKKVTRHLNLHSFGHMYTMRWRKDHVNFTNKTIYRFRLVQGGPGKEMITNHVREVANDPNAKRIRKL